MYYHYAQYNSIFLQQNVGTKGRPTKEQKLLTLINETNVQDIH